MRYGRILKSKFGYSGFRPNQLKIIRTILETKRDVVCILFTGSGKSLCYQYPAVYTGKISLVISPLIALMNDQKEKMDALGIPTACLNGTVWNKEEIIADILSNKYRVVYTTPEYVVAAKTFIKQLKSMLVMVAIDECHCISRWGHDFRPSYRKLHKIRTWLPGVQMCLLTATATPEVEADVIKAMKLRRPLVAKSTFDRPNIHIAVEKKNNIKKDLCNVIKGKSVIIYCQKRKQTEEIAKMLRKNKIKAACYHGGMITEKREKVHTQFITNKIAVIVATVAFGMGIDHEISSIVWWGIPGTISQYVQGMGRAVRSGAPGYCYLFYSLKDLATNDFLVNQIRNPAYRAHSLKLADSMKQYLYETGCRRKYILSYFGETYNKKNCGNCDNCTRPVNTIKHDFTNEGKLMLGVINKTGGCYGRTMIIDILRGSKAKNIYYKNIPEYGAGIHHGKEWWKIFNRMLINFKYIAERSVTGKTMRYVAQHVTKDGLCWLRSTKSLVLTIPEEMQAIYTNMSELHTSIITYDMYRNGISLREIAKKRKMGFATIENHIVALYKAGYDITFSEFGLTTEMCKKIRKKANIKQLKKIKESIPRSSYLQIKLALADKDADPRICSQLTYMKIKNIQQRIFSAGIVKSYESMLNK